MLKRSLTVVVTCSGGCSATEVSVTESRFQAAAVRVPRGLAVGASRLGSCWAKLAAASLSRTRSWGRLGPATLGSTVARSSERVAVYSASGAPAVWERYGEHTSGL